MLLVTADCESKNMTAKSLGPQALVVRTSAIQPECGQLATTRLHWLLKVNREGEPVRVVEKCRTELAGPP